MLLFVDDNKTIAELQEKFAECFPGLSIEFFKTPHGWNGASLTEDAFDKYHKIGEIRKKHEPSIVEIRSSYTAGSVEKEFKRRLSLFIQIYYSVNNKSIQTIHTDRLSLAQLSCLSQKKGCS